MNKGWLALAFIGLLAVPGISDAASATAIFGEIVPIMDGARGLLFSLCVLGILYLAYRTLKEFFGNREEGNWPAYLIGTVIAAVFAFLVVPRIIAPGLALGATLR